MNIIIPGLEEGEVEESATPAAAVLTETAPCSSCLRCTCPRCTCPRCTCPHSTCPHCTCPRCTYLRCTCPRCTWKQLSSAHNHRPKGSKSGSSAACGSYSVSGQGSYGTIALFQKHDSSVNWARKTSSYPSTTQPEQTASCADYLLLVQAREEHAPHNLQALPLLERWVEPDLPHLDKARDLIDFDMSYAPSGELRNYIKENPAGMVTERFVLWVGRQVLYGLGPLQAKKMLHGDVKFDNLLVFPGRYPPHIRIGDLG